MTSTVNVTRATPSYYFFLDLFPGLLHFQFLIACRMQKQREKRRPGESYHVIHNTTVKCHHTSIQRQSDIWDPSHILCWLWRWEKRQQRATPSILNISRLKAMTPEGCWLTSMKIPSSDAIISWSEKTALFGLLIIVKGIEHKSAHPCESLSYCWLQQQEWCLGTRPDSLHMCDIQHHLGT